jgi:hypothetical protein
VGHKATAGNETRGGTDPKGAAKCFVQRRCSSLTMIARIPAGALMKVSDLRSRLAERFDADLTCPLMTGIFFQHHRRRCRGTTRR